MRSIEVTGRTHELKCWPREFEAVADGIKTFDVRVNDRHYRAGDVLVLKEYDPSVRPEVDPYTGREERVLVTYVYHGDDSKAPLPLMQGNTPRRGVSARVEHRRGMKETADDSRREGLGMPAGERAK